MTARRLTAALCALSTALSTGLPSPASAQRAEVRPARSGIAQGLTDLARAQGRSLFSYETLRLLYRYANRTYGRAPDAYDQAFAAGWRRAGVSPDLARRMWADKISPYEVELRATFHPAVARLGFGAARRQVVMAMKANSDFGDEPCLGGLPAYGDEAGPTAPDECREVAGTIWDFKHGVVPILHSAYRHEVRNEPVLVTDAELPVPCLTDLDCDEFSEHLHARCGTGDESDDSGTGDLEGVDALPGMCLFGPQWEPGHFVRLQGRNVFDTNAEVALLRVADEEGAPKGETMLSDDFGVLYVKDAAGVELAADSPEFRLVGDSQTWGGAAWNYLDITEQALLYHPDTFHTKSHPDLVDFMLPGDLPAGLYEVRLRWHPAALLDSIANPDAKALYASQMPSPLPPSALSNPIYVRVSGDEYDPVEYRYTFTDARVVEAQETYDDPVVNLKLIKLDLAEAGLQSDQPTTPDELLAQAKSLAGKLQAGEDPPGLLSVLDASVGPQDDLDEGDSFGLGATASVFLGPDQALIAFTEIWEDDGDGVPTWMSDTSAWLAAVTLQVAATSVKEFGFSEVMEFCTSEIWCAVVAAVVIVFIITVEVAEYFAAPEYLGMSMSLYPHQEALLLTRAHSMGLSPAAVRALHDEGKVYLPSLAPFSGQFTYPAENANSGTVRFSTSTALDGESAWDVTGGFLPGEAVEVKTMRSTNEDAWPDDTATYRVRSRLRREP